MNTLWLVKHVCARSSQPLEERQLTTTKEDECASLLDEIKKHYRWLTCLQLPLLRICLSLLRAVIHFLVLVVRLAAVLVLLQPPWNGGMRRIQAHTQNTS